MSDIQQDTITAKEFFDSMVESPPDDTCRTCRFWCLSITYIDNWGICTNPDVSSRSDVNTFGDVAHISDYGCRFHRQKEAG